MLNFPTTVPRYSDAVPRRHVDPDILEVALFANSVTDWSASPLARNALLAEAGVSIPPSAFLLLRYLEHFSPLSVSGLATLVGLHPSTISTQLRPLIDGGLADSVPDNTDRRAMTLSITTAGRTLCERVREAAAEQWEVVLSGWSPDDRRLLAELLRRVRTDVVDLVADFRADGGTWSLPLARRPQPVGGRAVTQGDIADDS